MQQAMMKPLDGIRVVDLSHVLAMPYATMILGDLGAQVIKIERPVVGDDSRSFGPHKNGTSGYFVSVNRNKLSVTLDLKKDGAKEVLKDLIRASHVLAENYKPGTLAKLGFSYEAIKELNPAVIYASISGFGHDSQHPGRPGYDIIAQAFGGLMSITGYPDAPPTRVGASVADIISGLFTCIGILGALRTAEATGKGQQLDTAMVDCVLAVLENAVVRYTVTGRVPERIGSRHPSVTPFDVFRTADGYVVIAVGNDNLWERLCDRVPELNHLLKDHRLKTNVLRTEHHDVIKKGIEDWSATLATDRVVDIVSGIGVPCSPVNTVDKVLQDQNTRQREMVAEFDHPVAGKFTTANNPIHFSETPCKEHVVAPVLGQHTETVLSDVLGYSQDKIESLRKAGAFG